MHTQCALCRCGLVDLVEGAVESCGLICTASHETHDTRTAGTIHDSTSLKPAPSCGQRGWLAHADVHRASLWAFIPRDPVLWEKLHKLTVFSLSLCALLLLVEQLVPIRALRLVAGAVPLYVVLPLFGLLWYPAVFTEARCLRRGQYRVNTPATRHHTVTTTPDGNVHRPTPPQPPTAGSPRLPGLIWRMLTSELPPAPPSHWVRGDTTLPVHSADAEMAANTPDAACEGRSALAHTTQSVQSTCQQMDKCLTLVLFSAFVIVLESSIPTRAVAAVLSTILNSLLYAFYVYDYRYVQDGATVAEQVADFDAHTAYYCGYGLLPVMAANGAGWLTGLTMVGPSLSFGLYGWHVAFSDHTRGTHRQVNQASDKTTSTSMMPPRKPAGPCVFTHWFQFVYWFSAHAAVIWRCALLFTLLTLLAAVR